MARSPPVGHRQGPPGDGEGETDGAASCHQQPGCAARSVLAVNFLQVQQWILSKFQVSSYSDEDIEDLSPTSTLSLCSECRAGEDRATVCDLLT